mgnify:CR=1 FL=1
MGRTRALRNVKEAELKDIPKLTKCGLVTAFKCVESVKMENVSKLGEVDGLKEGVEKKKGEEEMEKKRKEIEEAAKRKAVIGSVNDWNRIDKTVGVIVVGDKCCNEKGCSVFDMSGFVYLKEVKVGSECFQFVNELNITGLSELESVVIGKNCFTQHKNSYGNDSNRHFYLKNCPKLKSLKIGRYSFSDYTVCEIENVDALEVIEIGGMNEDSDNFYYASLELKSILIHSE